MIGNVQIATAAYPPPLAISEPAIPKCNIFTQTSVAKRVINKLPIDNNAYGRARPSARSQLKPGIVRFCKSTTPAANVTKFPSDERPNKRFAMRSEERRVGKERRSKCERKHQ